MANSLKYLVLKLHSLNEKEKNWVLSNLSSPERDRVTRLLNELSSIKHSSNRGMMIHSVNELTESKQQDQIDSENKERMQLQKIVKKIDKSDSAKITQVLEYEDPWLSALILDYRQWNWTKEVETALSYDKLKIINKLRDEYNLSLNHDIMLVIFNILLMSMEQSVVTDGTESSPEKIDFDAFNNFTNSQEYDSSKNWWREWWHT